MLHYPVFPAGPPISLQLEVGGAVNDDAERMAYVAVEMKSVIFTCSFLADPMPYVTWLLDDVTIDINQNRYTVTRNYQDLGSIGNFTEQLTIVGVVREDAGTYTCTGINSHGSTQAVQNLTVIGRNSF